MSVHQCKWCKREGEYRKMGDGGGPMQAGDIVGHSVGDTTGNWRTEYLCWECHVAVGEIMDRLEAKHGVAYTSEIKRAMHIHLTWRRKKAFAERVDKWTAEQLATDTAALSGGAAAGGGR